MRPIEQINIEAAQIHEGTVPKSASTRMTPDAAPNRHKLSRRRSRGLPNCDQLSTATDRTLSACNRLPERGPSPHAYNRGPIFFPDREKLEMLFPPRPNAASNARAMALDRRWSGRIVGRATRGKTIAPPVIGMVLHSAGHIAFSALRSGAHPARAPACSQRLHPIFPRQRCVGTTSSGHLIGVDAYREPAFERQIVRVLGGGEAIDRTPEQAGHQPLDCAWQMCHIG
jgi:hypothetical protein